MEWITGHFGFSYIGFILLLMLMIPNLIWTKNQPLNYTSVSENKILSIFERIGEVLVTCIALIFSDFNIHKWSLWAIWLYIAAILMILYEGYWIRYFKSQKTLADFYCSFCGIPVAGATLTVFAFLCLGIYGKVIWLIIAVIILGIGHIGIHLQHLRELKSKIM